MLDVQSYDRCELLVRYVRRVTEPAERRQSDARSARAITIKIEGVGNGSLPYSLRNPNMPCGPVSVCKRYLYEFLYGWLISSLTRADTFLVDQEQVVNARVRRNKPRKKKTRPYTREIVFHQALQNMCGGYYKAMLGFRQDGKLPLPHPEFDCERVRYEHRFAPFSGLVTPPPVQYQEFHDVTLTLQHSPSQNLYTHGCKHFHQARTLLESITNPDTEINELLRVTKTNFVVLKLLATGHKRESSNPPEFDFSYHHHFPIIKIH
ncbi:N-alpha-acetyltransferase 35, NatC auxiliary subunit [Homalodisca vitripennis]|uniref:N-alpha-acetyltransferase 35, NatC auxiliary subunit n=1 Tax=Homalodisca vitripennis TaxID=197043 RepID=UPI001EECA796|nr:N-alpha-acetyltransferase 35, NatC auxiliary subunit [Homalodisca vitripennis]